MSETENFLRYTCAKYRQDRNSIDEFIAKVKRFLAHCVHYHDLLRTRGTATVETRIQLIMAIVLRIFVLEKVFAVVSHHDKEQNTSHASKMQNGTKRL